MALVVERKLTRTQMYLRVQTRASADCTPSESEAKKSASIYTDKQTMALMNGFLMEIPIAAAHRGRLGYLNRRNKQ